MINKKFDALVTLVHHTIVCHIISHLVWCIVLPVVIFRTLLLVNQKVISEHNDVDTVISIHITLVTGG